jgi:uncharacterized protein YndB with AHSA1/START domain
MSEQFDPKLDFAIERFIDAPTRLVWEALTKPEHLKEWYMPRQWGRVSRSEMDLGINRSTGFQQGTEIAVDQFAEHVMAVK